MTALIWSIAALMPAMLAGRIASTAGRFAMTLDRFHSPAECSVVYLSGIGRWLCFYLPASLLTVTAALLMPHWFGAAFVLVYVPYKYKSGARLKVLDEIDRVFNDLRRKGHDAQDAFQRANRSVASIVGWPSTNYTWLYYQRRNSDRQVEHRETRNEGRASKSEGHRSDVADDDAPSAARPKVDLSPILLITREEVEDGAVDDVVATLATFLASAATVRLYRGRIDIRFHGYNDDTRELFVIPEVRRYIAGLDAHFPYWFWFLRRDTGALKVIMWSLCNVSSLGPGLAAVDNSDQAIFLMTHFEAINMLAEHYGLSEPEIESLSEEIAQYLSASEVHN